MATMQYGEFKELVTRVVEAVVHPLDVVDNILHDAIIDAWIAHGYSAVKASTREQTPSAPHPHDAVNHPSHYTQHPSGVECIDITEHYNFNLGNAIKYIWRAGLKQDGTLGLLEDLRKAAWYLDRQIKMVEARTR